MTISFVNPGEIDITSVEIMGLSAKTTTSPIGRFGTGLKYAIAITLRLGGSITIWSGTTRYDFKSETLKFRNAEVKRVTIIKAGEKPVYLSFTLDYGQDWKPWQAFRELESNARDEGGNSWAGKLTPEKGKTVIWVTCPEIEAAFLEKSKYFLSSNPICVTQEENVEVHHWAPGAAQTEIYYRGVYVGNVEKPLRFCYNFHDGLPLSENRSIEAHAMYSIKRRLAWTVLQSENAEYIQAILTSPACYEQEVDLPSPAAWDSTATFHQVVEAYCAEGRANLIPISYLHWHYKAKKKDELLYSAYSLSNHETALVRQLTPILSRHFNCELPPIHFVHNLPENTLGLVAGDKIYISKTCFDKGEVCVLGTIFEEMCHWKLKHDDECRAFQNYLIDQIARLLLELEYTK